MFGNNKKSYTETMPPIPCLLTLIGYRHQYMYILTANDRARQSLQWLIELRVKRIKAGVPEELPHGPTHDEWDWWKIFYETAVHSVAANYADDKPVSARLAAHSGMYRDMRGLDEEPELVLDKKRLQLCSVSTSRVTERTLYSVAGGNLASRSQDSHPEVLKLLPGWMHAMVERHETTKRDGVSLDDRMQNLRDRMKLNEWVYEQRKGL